jgi:hypothetical protein
MDHWHFVKDNSAAAQNCSSHYDVLNIVHIEMCKLLNTQSRPKTNMTIHDSVMSALLASFDNSSDGKDQVT